MFKESVMNKLGALFKPVFPEKVQFKMRILFDDLISIPLEPYNRF